MADPGRVSGVVRPLHLIPGDPRHGVALYARQVAEATVCPIAADTPPPHRTPLHLHFTDRLWGPSPEQAAARVETLATQHPLSVTLHDLPQASDGAVNQLRRGDAYRRVLQSARAVVCASRWERELLSTLGDAGPTAVIPLPVIRLASPTGTPPALTGPPTVGLLGWIYPGKGHAETIAAAATIQARTGSPVRVIALGEVSDGHAREADRLRELAARRGVAFSITGYLPERELATRAASITVPLAAHRHISASGSINTWLSLGRRPLVSRSRYTCEMSRLRPGTLSLFDPGQLTAALARSCADPASTWLPAEVALAPHLDDVAASYLRWWSETVPW